MTANRLIQFLAHEAKAVRQMAYERGNTGPDAGTLEAFLLLVPASLVVSGLQPIGDAEANAIRYQLKQELIGQNAHVHEG